MLDNMASLREAMEKMDAQDPAVAQAAKDRAAQILKDAKLSFTKMAELIEQRRLLLRPKILAGIKRMDHEMLGDVAFRDTGSALRREGQSFRQIAEAIELNSSPEPRRGPELRHEDLVHRSEPSHEITSEVAGPAPVRAANAVARIVFFPLRHPFQFLTIALLAIGLLYIFGVIGTDRPRERGASSAAAPPTPASPIPSPQAAPSPTRSASPTSTQTTTAPASSTSPTPSPNACSCPPGLTPSRDTNSAPILKSSANDYPQTTSTPIFGSLIPAKVRRNSSSAGQCVAGVGGCKWGGGQF
jgi:hypothetical protein